MDTSATEIRFDKAGVCSFCHDFDQRIRPVLERSRTMQGRQQLEGIIEWIRSTGKRREYDSILALSGGVDSSFLAHVVAQYELRPLAVCVDTGWSTPVSTRNIESLAEKLGLPLHVIPVPFDAMRRLQVAFYVASVKNCEIPQDHAYLAMLYREASRRGIRAILSGGNHSTESILPQSWGFNSADVRHIRSIHADCGTGSLRGFPTLGFFRRYLYYPAIRGIREVRLLNFMPYERAYAKRVLVEKYGWSDYGAKHFESVLTRFYQGYYLPTKFGIDKRKAHFSSLILSGQMTREEALEELRKPPYPPGILENDMREIAEKLELMPEEWKRILAAPARLHEEFRSLRALFAAKDLAVQSLGIRARMKR